MWAGEEEIAKYTVINWRFYTKKKGGGMHHLFRMNLHSHWPVSMQNQGQKLDESDSKCIQNSRNAVPQCPMIRGCNFEDATRAE